MRKYFLGIAAALLLFPTLITATSKIASMHDRGHTARLRPVALISDPGRAAGSNAAIVDTIYLLGGPDRLDGKFETADGEPDWHGWIGVDMQAQTSPHWHVDTYNCAGLDSLTPGNHAWWCGQYWEDDCETEDFGGYGNEWLAYLDWFGTVPDPASDVSVRVTARLNYDNEPNWDYLYFDCITQSSLLTLDTYNGSNQDSSGNFVPVDFEVSFIVNAGDFVGELCDQVHLRWRFDSDGSYSDQDCLFPTEGAAQIDQIAVYFDQGFRELQVGTTETCEPGDPVQWAPGWVPGCGNFAQIWPSLCDIDPCHENDTPQVAFIDDGIVVPGTGGSQCITWCYGPGGYIVNPDGGLMGPNYGVRNWIWSPILDWPGGDFVGATLEFDVYLHENFGEVSPGFLVYWRIRSTASSDPSDPQAWTPWTGPDHNYWGGPRYLRVHEDAKGWTEQDCTHVQLALGVTDYLPYSFGSDGTPAPYFDNVVFKVHQYLGPDVYITDTASLAQDNFPEIGTIDYTNLGANHVRFDRTWIDGSTGRAQDDLRLWVAPLRPGAVLVDRPKLHYKLKANPLFDSYRTAGLPNQGFVYGDSVVGSSGELLEHTFSFDLPDTGFLYPGDVLHYFYEGQDVVGGVVGTTLLPADTTGFARFPGEAGFVPTLYPQAFTMRALPSLHSAAEGDHPAILLWHDREEWFLAEAMDAWSTALANLGYREGVDYDLYWSHGAFTVRGNGIGWRATATQLQHYQTLLYSSGAFEIMTMREVDYSERTLLTLDSWLHFGNKSMFLTGDSFIHDLYLRATGTSLNFISNWIGVSYVQKDVGPLIDNQSAPLIRAVSGNPVFHAITDWIAYGGCPETRYFDAVVTQGNAERIAEFTTPSGLPGDYPYAAAVHKYRADFNNNVIYLPYDFNHIMTPAHEAGAKEPAALAARTRLLAEVLYFLGHMGSSPSTDVPERDRFSVTCSPNPFNPSTKITYHMPQRGELSLKIYNIRGELVKTLIDEVVEAGSGFVVWDGTDGGGHKVASGVYFYKASSTGGTFINKIALIK